MLESQKRENCQDYTIIFTKKTFLTLRISGNHK